VEEIAQKLKERIRKRSKPSEIDDKLVPKLSGRIAREAAPATKGVTEKNLKGTTEVLF
jgi:hypothetical protein